MISSLYKLRKTPSYITHALHQLTNQHQIIKFKMETDNHEALPLKGDSKLDSDPYITDDEDETSTPEGTSNFNSSNSCYQRRGRIYSKRSSKLSKNGHSRTKSEGSALFQQGINGNVSSAGLYGQRNITDNLTNVEMLSNCQISRRRVASASRDRDLSPVEVVRHYITKEKEQIDVMIGRIVHNVEDMAEVAAQKVSFELWLRTN